MAVLEYVKIDEGVLSSIASAIRFKNSMFESYKPSEMASAIRSLPFTPGSVIDISYLVNGDPLVKSVINSNISIIASYKFSLCTGSTLGNGLETVSFPNCEIIGQSAFANCLDLNSISFPKCTTIQSYAFQHCTSLETASFPKCEYIGSYAFSQCTNLKSLYLLGSTVAVLGGDAFQETLISTSNGSIYVPSSLYSQYITRSIWSVYSSKIVSV